MENTGNNALKIYETSIWNLLLVSFIGLLVKGFTMQNVAICLVVFVSVNLTMIALSWIAQRYSKRAFYSWWFLSATGVGLISLVLQHYKIYPSLASFAVVSIYLAYMLVGFARYSNVILKTTFSFKIF